MMRPWIAFCRRAVVLSAIATVALTVAACEKAPLPFTAKAPAFEGPPVWRVAADSIEIEQTPNVVAPGPAVAARLVVLPVDVARAWPRQRLRADPGARGVLVYTIERADASERQLPREKGLTALFRNSPEAEFTVAFAVNLNLFDATGARRGSARAESRATASFRENADETDRRRLWAKLMQEAAARLDAELQKQAPIGLKGMIYER